MRPRLTFANVASAIAVFIALGGTAIATHPGGQNTISSADIIDNTVRTDDIRDANLRTADIDTNAIISNKVADDTLTGADVDEAALDATPLRTRVSEGGCDGNDAQDLMVKVGSVCIDQYEVSVWSQPTGGTQYGVSSDDYPCNNNGEDCTNIYARSVPGVSPSRFITYFQAQQALANSGKRLPTNAEWQMAVAGTPDGAPCNVSSGSVQDTGANAGCISNHGTNDMVGNLWEWVADWDEEADTAACSNWGGGFGEDFICLGNDAPDGFPGALTRGGDFGDGTLAGSFAIDATLLPANSESGVGFRGAR